MASKHSYTITLLNNKTEKEGIDFVMSKDSSFLLPDKEGRKKILEVLNLDDKYHRTFDLFKIPGHTNLDKEILINSSKSITLIELKTTQKYLPNNPAGFFFGATKNEFDLADLLKDRYKFCFVSLNSKSKSFKIVEFDELQKMIKLKREQYQINL